MTQDIVEIVRRSYDAYERGDADSMLSDTHEDLVTYREAPDGATFHGRQGLIEAITSWTEGFDRFEFTIEELIPANDRQVIARIHQRAVGAQSGVEIEATFWFVHTFDGGKLSRLDMFADRDRASEAAGLDPE